MRDLGRCAADGTDDAPEQVLEGIEHDLEIAHDGPVVDVEQVEASVGVERRRVACLHLPEAGDARLDELAAAQVVVEFEDFLGQAAGRRCSSCRSAR